MPYSRGFNLIHRSDLLNALLALQSAHSSGSFGLDDREREIYQAGFDSALLAMAQMLGQSETFLAEKRKLKDHLR